MMSHTEDPCLYLNKDETGWIMNKETFAKFMKHVFSYYQIIESSETLTIEDVEYATIAEYDLCIVSYIFGLNRSGHNQTMLAPVYPSVYTIPLTGMFKIQVFKKNSGTATLHSIILNHI